MSYIAQIDFYQIYKRRKYQLEKFNYSQYRIQEFQIVYVESIKR